MKRPLTSRDSSEKHTEDQDALKKIKTTTSSDHTECISNHSPFKHLPHHVILDKIFDFFEFQLHRYFYISDQDQEQYEGVDFSAAFRNWDIREEIGFRKLRALVFGYFANDPSRKIHLLFKHVNFEFVNCPNQHSQLVTCMRLKGLKSLIWPTFDISQVTLVEFPYFQYCPNIENLTWLDISESHSYEQFMKFHLPLKKLTFEHSDENETGKPAIFDSKYDEFFSKFCHITHLNMTYCAINDQSIEIMVKHLKNLQVVEFAENPAITLHGAKTLLNASNMRSIDLSNTNAQLDGMFQDLDHALSNLKVLALSPSDGISDAFFKHLNVAVFKNNFLPSLSEISLTFVDENFGNADYLKQFFEESKSLRKFSALGSTEHIWDHVFSDPHKITNVTHLSLDYNNFQILSQITQLKGLDPGRLIRNVNDLAILNQIEELSLSLGFQLNQVLHLLHNPDHLQSLKRLYLEIDDVSEDVKWDLIELSHPNLKISLNVYNASDATLNKLLSCNLVDKLDLSLTTKNSQKGLAVLPKNQSLTFLRVAMCNRGSIQAIMKNTSLERLEIPYEHDIADYDLDDVMKLFENSSCPYISFKC
ncbi:hypothetical protein C9374_006557 [Naegleria lovaniensis]|uniref:Uncharacterized protein n=1 Tax=Naegleria lovaniensis TaxID=51637 RepID=A0AA88GMD3_NAELO|nr:uncharacterized protein C9374_006557 [Naegleria lovaniensis]KAG2379440.1 hypothetical protein C9374_006557 [Naegleria lovaniensis]